MDESCPHGSATVAEIVAQALEQVWDICKKRGTCFPSSVILLGDNTVRELKNQYMLQYMSNLIARRKIRMGGILFLRKSHTHDKIDQLWGLLARRISNTDTLLDPESTIEVITKELQRPGIRQWIGSTTELHISKLNATRNWRDNWKTQGVALEGGLLEDATANHSFVMMSRKGPTVKSK